MALSNGQVPIPHTIQSPEVDFSKPVNVSLVAGKTIVITGGASGLGAGFFTAWASYGACVIIGDVNEVAGKALVKKTRSVAGNQNLHFHPLDVTSWSSQLSFFQKAVKLSPHGGIDVVVANAGISGSDETAAFENPPGYTAASLEASRPPSLKILDINLTGVIYTTTLANSFLSRNPGSEKCSLKAVDGPRDRLIILVSSCAGLMPLSTQSIYAASKHAVIGLFRSLRITMPIVHGIRVNVLCPYFVATPLLGLAGNVILAGGGVATTVDVVEAATRLVADKGIIGRGLAIGPKVNMGDMRDAGLDVADVQSPNRAVWDVYAHDFEQSDIFTRRIIALTNLTADRRGWIGLLGDLGWAISSPVRRLFG